MKFHGKTVLVTGAASGIGHATACRFGEVGARLIVADIDAARGEAAAVDLRATGVDARFIQMDIMKPESVQAGAEQVRVDAGRLDVLVNAAGWDIIEPFMDNTPDYWAKVVGLNFMGPIQVTRALLPLLIESGSGRIVNIGSDAGRVGSYGETVYAAAKGGIIAFTKSLARELTRKQVRVNCVCPGPTDTPLFATHSDKMKQALIGAIPMKRLARPSEVADAVLFFASDRSSFVTGQVLSVSGGLTMVD
jgi:2-hydroxycyclohexanecarboxyl-CoA dehydrogenase